MQADERRNARAARESATRRWIVLALLSLGVMISFIDRTSIASALAAPGFRQHFAMTDVERGWVASAFFWSYALVQVPFGALVDRRGVKRPYAVCFLLWCLATAATAAAGGVAMLLALRLVVGAAEAIVVPASWRWIRDNVTEAQSGTAVGVFMFGTKIGPAIGAPLAAWLIAVADWRAMFVIVGAAGLVWLIPWMAVVPDDRAAAVGRPVGLGARHRMPVRRLLVSPLIRGTIVVNFCYNYFTFFCMTWMPAYLVERRGLSLARMGLYAFFSFAGIALVALVAGWAADRLIAGGRPAAAVRKGFTIAGFACAATVVMGAHAHTQGAALFWNVASLSGLGLATANYNALCRLTLIPAPLVGLVTGVQQVATALAGIAAPLITGWLLQVSGRYELAIDAIFVFLAIGALTTGWLLRRDEALDRDAARMVGSAT